MQFCLVRRSAAQLSDAISAVSTAIAGIPGLRTLMVIRSLWMVCLIVVSSSWSGAGHGIGKVMMTILHL